MNYRHAFHAGNFADVFKHAVLVALIESLKQKQTGFCVLDTHAGSARYSLAGLEAQKTGEFALGIKPLLSMGHLPSTLHVYLNVVRSLNPGGAITTYPGSPLISSLLTRDQDRVIACELQPEEAHKLRTELAHDKRVATHHRDGYEALPALVPPKQKRGLVLIDPPFETENELERMVSSLSAAHARWPTGIYALWYPIKLRQEVAPFHRALVQSGIRKVLASELCLHPDNSALRLNGCGMIVVNPPFRFDKQIDEIGTVLLKVLAQSRFGKAETRWLVPE